MDQDVAQLGRRLKRLSNGRSLREPSIALRDTQHILDMQHVLRNTQEIATYRSMLSYPLKHAGICPVRTEMGRFTI